jgi:hypothetical protein
MSSLREVRVQTGAPATHSPFFIVGSGRSGSTLLRVMLSCHSRLNIPPETWFLIPLVRQFRTDRPLGADDIERAVSTITGAWSWPDMKLDTLEFQRRVGQLTEPYLRDLVEVVYRCHLEAEGKVRWGDKTPAYIEIVPELLSMYPQAQFIHVIRDGRDVAKSTQATGWRGRWLHDNTRTWTEALEHHARWAQMGFRERILAIRYEDLVLTTEVTLRNVCRFLGEQYESQMLSWQGQVDEQIPARERMYHSKLKLKIGSEGVARWKREMSAREAFVAEAFMGANLTRLGYERRYPSRLWSPAFALTRFYCRTVLPALHFHHRAARSVRKRLGLRLESS